MSTYTKGPWEARTTFDPPHVVAVYQDEQDRRCTAFVATCESATLPNAANARLIAAAPDLYEALKRSLNWLSSYPGGGATSAWKAAHAAIQKAEEGTK